MVNISNDKKKLIIVHFSNIQSGYIDGTIKDLTRIMFFEIWS
jgi:hypothetical protein